MIEYIKAQSKTNEAIVKSAFNADELQRFSKADFRWAENRGKAYQTRKIKKGEIYQFEFGKNFTPEMSYEHRGLVIGVKKKLLYVLPIFSYDPKKDEKKRLQEEIEKLNTELKVKKENET